MRGHPTAKGSRRGKAPEPFALSVSACFPRAEHFSRSPRGPVRAAGRPDGRGVHKQIPPETAAFAQAAGQSPWENAVTVLQQAFTSTIARGLSLVAIVVAGLTFAFGEGGSKRVLAGVLFGVGMAIAAVNFLAWLFPGN